MKPAVWKFLLPALCRAILSPPAPPHRRSDPVTFQRLVVGQALT